MFQASPLISLPGVIQNMSRGEVKTQIQTIDMNFGSIEINLQGCVLPFLDHNFWGEEIRNIRNPPKPIIIFRTSNNEFLLFQIILLVLFKQLKQSKFLTVESLTKVANPFLAKVCHLGMI